MIDSKSVCILRPATSTTMPSDMAPPTSQVSRSGPTIVTLPSSTSSAGLMRRYSKARARLPPNSMRRMSLRTRSPSKAEPNATGIGTLFIFTLTPRTSMQRWMSFSARSMSSAPGISSKGIETTCS